MSELIIKIGPLFWVLSLLAVYGLAVVAERILYFHRIQINTGDFLRGISRLVNAGSVDEARHEASILPGPGARVVSSVLAHSGLERQELRTVAEDSVQMEVFQIEKNIRGLLVVATVSDAVFQALLSSALGLSIAIPAYLFYCYLASRARQVVHSLERAGTEAVCLVCDARQRRENGERMGGREA